MTKSGALNQDSGDLHRGRRERVEGVDHILSPETNECWSHRFVPFVRVH